MTLDARLMRLIEVEPVEDGCWIWKGALDYWGRPHVTRQQRRRSARRLIFEEARHPITRGMFIAVPCDDQLCVNPAHLRMVTKRGYLALAKARGVAFGNAVSLAKIVVRAQERSPYGWDDVRQLRALTDDGMPVLRAAAMLGINKNSAYKIAYRKRWKETATSPLALIARQAGWI